MRLIARLIQRIRQQPEPQTQPVLAVRLAGFGSMSLADDERFIDWDDTLNRSLRPHLYTSTWAADVWCDFMEWANGLKADILTWQEA